MLEYADQNIGVLLVLTIDELLLFSDEPQIFVDD